MTEHLGENRIVNQPTSQPAVEPAKWDILQGVESQ